MGMRLDEKAFVMSGLICLIFMIQMLTVLLAHGLVG